MRSMLGVLLIVFGLCAGAGSAATNRQAETNGMPAEQRFYQAIGGALCSLTLVVLGIAVALTSGSKSSKGKRHEESDRAPRRNKPPARDDYDQPEN